MTDGDRENLKKQIGDQIRKIRQSRGVSQKDLVSAIRSRFDVRLDTSYYSRMELGRVEIPLRTLVAIADVLSISPGILIDPALRTAEPNEHAAIIDNTEISSALSILYLKLGKDETGRQLRRWLSDMVDFADELEKHQRLRAASPSSQENVRGEKT